MNKLRLLLILLVTTISLQGCVTEFDDAISTCLKYTKAVDIGMCINDIALEQDSKRTSLSICDRIPNGVKHACRRNVAVKFDDKDLCFENENPIEIPICLTDIASIRKSVGICDEITESKSRNMCIRQVAATVADQAMCDRITDDEAMKTYCIETVQFVVSERAKSDSETSDASTPTAEPSLSIGSVETEKVEE